MQVRSQGTPLVKTPQWLPLSLIVKAKLFIKPWGPLWAGSHWFSSTTVLTHSAPAMLVSLLISKHARHAVFSEALRPLLPVPGRSSSGYPQGRMGTQSLWWGPKMWPSRSTVSTFTETGTTLWVGPAGWPIYSPKFWLPTSGLINAPTSWTYRVGEDKLSQLQEWKGFKGRGLTKSEDWN